MFYTFHQNNSGGSFVIDEDVTVLVVVEADSAEEANERAETFGIYFDGCDSGWDCSCCGDRWYRAWDEEGDAVPSSYGVPLEEDRHARSWARGQPWAYVYYKNGVRGEYCK